MKKYFCFAVGYFAAILLVSFAYTATAQPGDAADPLVTRRFVEERIAALSEEIIQLRAIVANIAPGALQGVAPQPEETPATSPPPPFTPPTPQQNVDIEGILATVMYYFEAVYGERLEAALRNVPGPVGDPQPPQPPPQNVFVVLNPSAGQSITFEAGTEVILRGGTALAITGPYNGIPDITAGADIMNGTAISHNHLLIFPVSDGRGMRFETGAWIMVRGGYNIAG